MSEHHELKLRLRFSSTEALVAFMSHPPSGVRIVVENGSTPVTARRAHRGHTAARWTPEEDELLLEELTSETTFDAESVRERLDAKGFQRTYAAINSRKNALINGDVPGVNVRELTGG